MNWADYAILTIISLSALISVWRGFVKEALSLAALVLAFWLALTFHEPLAMWLAPYIEAPSLQKIAAFTTLFVVTLILGGLVNYLAGQLVKKSGLSGTDRFLGVLFGLVRGGLLVAILVLLAGLTQLPKDPWWGDSVFIVHFQEVAVQMKEFLPASTQKDIQY